ncbi:MAG: adenosylmethionine--8-amino-7-oxononanoate transaminase [Legionellales bacterium]|nr:adenosylmethionine--8-amino-7-oxononanoate transaminase [Legionellales bacterium]
MTSLIHRDLQCFWHPCAQMKDYEDFPPLEIVKAYGCYLELVDGQRLIDAISSWWCKSLGHGHPKLTQALFEQAEQFEHVILANTTHSAIVELSERLTQLTSTLTRVMYASDGSCAVEMAMKMSIHARQLLGQSQRQRFVALANGYHGETAGALSVSDVGLYRDPYRSLLMDDVVFINHIPYVSGEHDPLWQDCADHWQQYIVPQLAPLAEHTTALILEPIVQGAGGMKIYSQDFLRRLRHWTQQNDIHLIADEIMTGFGRTGLPLACQHANIEPDFLCLAKGLTAGYLPLSAMLTSEAIYELFYDDYASGKAFLHSHTHTGNALAVRIALTCLQVLVEENIYQTVQQRAPLMYQCMQQIAEQTQQITNIRQIGAITAADLIVSHPQQRRGYAVYQQAVKLGALLRPLGNTIYWLPPLNMDTDTLYQLRDVTRQAIEM